MQKKIYENGIRFKCQGSSNCCISRGSYGFVYLTKNDLKKLANYLKISLEKFKTHYCQTNEGFTHLKDLNLNGECIFLNNKKCSVYKARPTQCRTYPFWQENLNYKTWSKNVVNFCPGIGKGKLISKKKIESLLNIDRLNEKKIFKERN